MSTLRIIDCDQRTDEWYAARCGLVTASIVKSLVTAKTLATANNIDSRTLVYRLAAERVTGVVEPSYVNDDMLRGIDAEPYALDLYAKHHTPAAACGFMVRDYGGYSLGYSPDGLVGADGLIEIKAPRQKEHLKTIVEDEVPGYHLAQLQAGMLVSGRAWCDYISYHAGMPLWVRRVEADPVWHTAILAATEATEQRIADAIAAYGKAADNLPATERVAELELRL